MPHMPSLAHAWLRLAGCDTAEPKSHCTNLQQIASGKKNTFHNNIESFQCYLKTYRTSMRVNLLNVFCDTPLRKQNRQRNGFNTDNYAYAALRMHLGPSVPSLQFSSSTSSSSSLSCSSYFLLTMALSFSLGLHSFSVQPSSVSSVEVKHTDSLTQTPANSQLLPLKAETGMHFRLALSFIRNKPWSRMLGF